MPAGHARSIPRHETGSAILLTMRRRILSSADAASTAQMRGAGVGAGVGAVGAEEQRAGAGAERQRAGAGALVSVISPFLSEDPLCSPSLSPTLPTRTVEGHSRLEERGEPQSLLSFSLFTSQECFMFTYAQ